jgi:hypothetical protein
MGLFSLHDHEVIADCIEPVAVDLIARGTATGAGAKFLIEHPVAEPLARFDFAGAHGLAQDQLAAGGANVWRMWQYRSLLAGVFATDTRNLKVL